MHSVATGERLVLGRVFGVWVQWGSSFQVAHGPEVGVCDQQRLPVGVYNLLTLVERRHERPVGLQHPAPTRLICRQKGAVVSASRTLHLRTVGLLTGCD